MFWKARGVGEGKERGEGLYREDGFSGGEGGICNKWKAEKQEDSQEGFPGSIELHIALDLGYSVAIGDDLEGLIACRYLCTNRSIALLYSFLERPQGLSTHPRTMNFSGKRTDQ